MGKRVFSVNALIALAFVAGSAIAQVPAAPSPGAPPAPVTPPAASPAPAPAPEQPSLRQQRQARSLLRPPPAVGTGSPRESAACGRTGALSRTRVAGSDRVTRGSLGSCVGEHRRPVTAAPSLERRASSRR